MGHLHQLHSAVPNHRSVHPHCCLHSRDCPLSLLWPSYCYSLHSPVVDTLVTYTVGNVVLVIVRLIAAAKGQNNKNNEYITNDNARILDFLGIVVQRKHEIGDMFARSVLPEFVACKKNISIIIHKR
jgi:hypothetical protein